MRIISGKFKGRKLTINKKYNFRPTTERNREMIFNIITNSNKISIDISTIKILDVFSGSGILSLEAASRGATLASLIDINPDHLQTSRENFSKIAPNFIANFYQLDLIKKIPLAKTQHDLVFIDPPYATNITAIVLEKLIKQNWIKKDALIIAEIPNIQQYFIDISNIFTIIETRIVGNSAIVFLEDSKT